MEVGQSKFGADYVKMSPFACYLEQPLQFKVTAYRKKLLQASTYHFKRHHFCERQKKTIELCSLRSPEESANERV